MEPTTSFTPASLWPIFATSIGFALVAFCLAKNKGRRTLPWTLVALVPLINMFCLTFLVGASNLRLERKLDKLLQLLTERGNGVMPAALVSSTGTSTPGASSPSPSAQWSDAGTGPD